MLKDLAHSLLSSIRDNKLSMEYKKEIEKLRKNAKYYGKCALSETQKNECMAIAYGGVAHKSDYLKWIDYIVKKNQSFDKFYVPEPVFYLEIKQRFNDANFAIVYSDKAYLDLYCNKHFRTTYSGSIRPSSRRNKATVTGI